MIINDAGTYTLKYTATDDCGKTSTVDRELVVTSPIYGIISRSATSPVCERIGASADFEDPVAQYSDGNGGWIGGSSPFDDIMPWSGMQIVEDAEAGTLVSIPKFYYKWTRNGDEMQLEISARPQEGFLTSPAHADRGDGVGERDVVYVSRYLCGNVGYKSATEEAPVGNTLMSDMRTNIHALGSDVWQYDFAMLWTIRMLYLVEFANWNSQNKIGRGGTLSGSVVSNNGETDSMPYHTGSVAALSSGSIGYGPAQYRHIEALWSNASQWCDGVYFVGQIGDEGGLSIYCINNPADFNNSTGGTLVGKTTVTSGFTQNFTDPSLISGFEYALFASSSNNSSSENDSRTHDTQTFGNYKTGLLINGFVQNIRIGLFEMQSENINTKGSSTSCRLMKLPSA